MRGGALLLEARRRAGLTQVELANRVGTTQSAIGRIERGRTSPALEHLSRLIRACGFDLEVRLVPHDDHQWTLAQGNLSLEPTRRLEKMLAVARLRGAADGNATPAEDSGAD
jgi:transcriptional regulator with XRE-family HTH domain